VSIGLLRYLPSGCSGATTSGSQGPASHSLWPTGLLRSPLTVQQAVYALRGTACRPCEAPAEWRVWITTSAPTCATCREDRSGSYSSHARYRSGLGDDGSPRVVDGRLRCTDLLGPPPTEPPAGSRRPRGRGVRSGAIATGPVRRRRRAGGARRRRLLTRGRRRAGRRSANVRAGGRGPALGGSRSRASRPRPGSRAARG
jgi:hypothetical protein